jgi:multidrug resistance efflux pump
MLEILVCSLFTIVPDFLFRRYYQGKRLGHEITLYSIWYELRYGITGCLLLTIALITVIFYFHPSTSSVVAFYRTIPILPEISGRVAEVYVGPSQEVSKGERLFKLDSSKQEAAVTVARRRIAEIDASMIAVQADIDAAEGEVQQAKGAYEQALIELQTKQELQQRNTDVVAAREIERLTKLVETRQGGVTAANAAKKLRKQSSRHVFRQNAKVPKPNWREQRSTLKK